MSSGFDRVMCWRICEMERRRQLDPAKRGMGHNQENTLVDIGTHTLETGENTATIELMLHMRKYCNHDAPTIESVN